MCFLQLAVWDWFVAVRCLIIFPSTKFFLFSQLQLYMAFIFTVIICTFEFVFISLPCSRLFAAVLNFSFASFKVSHCLECIYLKLYDFPFDFWKLDYNMKKFQYKVTEELKCTCFLVFGAKLQGISVMYRCELVVISFPLQMQAL